MKIKYLILIFFVHVSYALVAEDRPNIPVKMLNVGKMAVTGSSLDKTLLYVEGSFSATSSQIGTNAQKSEIVLDNSKVEITGHFINNVQDGTVFEQPVNTTPGVVEFCGTSQQWITTDGEAYEEIPSKEENYVNFPNLLINNSSHVKITPEMAVKTKNIDLTKGWLIVDSRIPDAVKDYPAGQSNVATINNQTTFAHLFVDGNISYKNWTSADVEERGFIQVNMALNNEGKNVDSGINEGRPVVSLIGFGSPFDELKADYFMFNILIEPDHTGFFGKYGKPNRYPENTLKPGRGKILAIDLKGNNFLEEDYSSEGSAYDTQENFDQRAKDGIYYFNRHKFSVDPQRQMNQIYGSSTTIDAYKNEKLTNPDSYIEVPLCKGYNYLANPFLTPLDVGELLVENSEKNSWDVIVNGTAGNTQRDIYNGVWLLNPDSKAEYKGNKKAEFFYTYRILQNPGGTQETELIAPLQMFVVWAAKDTHIRIPKSARKMGDVKFIRSQKQPRQDDFIIEVIDEATYTSDRTNFVLRPALEIASRYKDKNIKRTQSSSSIGISEENSASKPNLLGSQLSTKGVNNEELTVNFLPLESTKFVQLYLKPSVVEQPIILQGLRLNSMTEISEMWLEDKMEKTIVPFNEETKYRAISRPTDIEDRFIVHFEKPQYSDSSEDRYITYYQGGKIFIEGFMPEDYGNKVYLYTINGSLLAQTIVDNYRVSIPALFTKGVYLVKVVGDDSYSVKVMIK